MSQDIDIDDVIKRIITATGMSRDEILALRDAKVKKFNGLLEPVGALLIVADDLKVKTVDPTPKADPKALSYPNDVKDKTCKWCGELLTWGYKVPTKNGKMAPGHIDKDGHLLNGTGECPNFAKPSPAGAAKGTIFDAPAAATPEPARKVMDDGKLAALLAECEKNDAAFDKSIEQPVIVKPAPPMVITPRKSDDDILAELLASEPPTPKLVTPHPATCSCEICLAEHLSKVPATTTNTQQSSGKGAPNPLPGNPSGSESRENVKVEAAPYESEDPEEPHPNTCVCHECMVALQGPKAQPTTPNGNQPPRAGLSVGIVDKAGSNPGNVVVTPPHDSGTVLAEYFAAIDLKGLIVRDTERVTGYLARIAEAMENKMAMAATNEADIATLVNMINVLSDRVAALEAKKAPTKKKSEEKKE